MSWKKGRALPPPRVPGEEEAGGNPHRIRIAEGLGLPPLCPKARCRRHLRCGGHHRGSPCGSLPICIEAYRAANPQGWAQVQAEMRAVLRKAGFDGP